MDIVGQIIAYENGELDEEQIIAFFQELLDTGLCWQLQGHYGRTARYLLEQGLIRNKTRKYKVMWVMTKAPSLSLRARHHRRLLQTRFEKGHNFGVSLYDIPYSV